jgi:hypothetical protein
VQVTIASTQPTFFGRVLGFDTADIQTVSLAEAGSVASGDSCTRPFFIPNDVFRLPGSDLCAGCAGGSGEPGEELIVFDFGDGEGWVKTPFAYSVLDDSAYATTPDSRFRLYPGSPGGAISPGQFYLIDLVVGESSGASEIADWIRGCDPEVNRTECSEFYSVKTGATAGGIKNGLFGNGANPGLLPDPVDTYDLVNHMVQVGGSPSNLSNSSPQLIIAPIWDVCGDTVGDYCTSGGIASGTGTSMPIVGYAQVFLEGPDPGPGPDDVTALLIDVIGCGELDDGIGPDPDLTGSTVLGRPLRLVREPDPAP